MKKFPSIRTFLLLILVIYWSFKAAMPSYKNDSKVAETSFSTDRALQHVAALSKEPHGVNSKGHIKAQRYIVSQLKSMGLQVELQEGYTTGDWANMCKATNIIAKIEGTNPGKALLLLSHYDSHPHSSLGASDAASGVATILEGVRTFLANKKVPKNDIIIMLSDAEEIGLNGADLFVNKHPWSTTVGLVLNFEARGSGGESIMLIETNGGNKNLIKEFTKANPKYPVANSLAYSIYKMLPNDTDLTVFREDKGIQGFNFAFIDDHYDYHTVRDSYERLDKNTLAHQGSYLMPLLNHFSAIDLESVKSDKDDIYFNIPFFKLVSYPFEWIWPMFTVAFVCFILLLITGLKRKKINSKDVFKGFLPLLIALVINGVVGFYSWSVLKWLYPHYKDMLHGFTYNGYTYIAAFTLFSIAICFWAYKKFSKITTPNLLVAPIVLWFIICAAVALYLPGASFFVIPLFALLVSFLILINQEKPNPYLLVFLAIPALWIYSPFIKMFPVGLGLKMLVAATVLATLTFFLLVPIVGFYKNKGRWAFLSMSLAIVFMISAHFNAGFSKENAKPTSLLYVLNTATNTAQWATYDYEISDWTRQYINTDQLIEKPDYAMLSSKYNTRFKYVSNAPVKEIMSPKIETIRDTIIENQRHITICITPQRSIDKLEIFTNNIEIIEASVNNLLLPKNVLKQKETEEKQRRLISYYVNNDSYTELNIVISKEKKLELTLYESSNDLLKNPLFTIPKRPVDNIPKPFVLNDAILVVKTIKF